MARGYKTASGRFVDDFVFDPNIELAKEVIKKKDGEIQERANSLKALGDLTFDFDFDFDSESAQATRDKINDIINEAESNIGNNFLNTSLVNKEIGEARRQIKDLYEFGDVKKLSENINKIKKTKAEIAALSGGDKKFHEEKLNRAIESSEGKSIESGGFQGWTPQKTGNYFADFLTTLPNLKPVKTARAGASPTGQGNIYTSSSTNETLTKERLKNIFIARTLDGGDIEARAAEGQERGENWYGPDGKISFEDGYFLGDKFNEGIAALEYSSESKTAQLTLDANHWKNIEYENSKKSFNNIFGIERDAQGAWRISNNARQYEKDETIELNKLDYYLSNGIDPNNATNSQKADAQDWYIRNRNSNSLQFKSIPEANQYFYDKSLQDGLTPEEELKYEYVKKVKRQTEEVLKASNKILAEDNNWKQAEKDSFDASLKTSYVNHFGLLPIRVLDQKYNFVKNGVKMRKTVRGASGGGKDLDFMTPQQMVGQYVVLADGSTAVIDDIVPTDHPPQIIPLNKSSYRDNDFLAVVNVYYYLKGDAKIPENLKYIEKEIIFQGQDLTLDPN